jgi:MFS superfamily sulfate permease-like transporter
MFGVDAGSGTTLEKFANTLRAIPTETNVPTLVVAISVLVVILGLGRVNKAIPGALIAVVGAIAASYFLDLAAQGVTTLGTVPGGLPSLSLPTDVMTTANVAALLPTVVSMFVVILAQSAATSRAYAMKYNDSFDENVDLVGLGTANFAAGLTGTFVVNGSPTKTEMVDGAGGRSQISQLTCGLLVIVVLLFLTGPLSYMPNAVLAAVVFLIGIRLVDLEGMSDVLRLRRGEFAVAAVTALTVVVVGIEQGIILAMALSIVEHVYHSYKPSSHLVGLGPDGLPDEEPVGSGTEIAPGLAVYRFGASLYYANTARFTEQIVSLAENASPPLRWLAVSASVIGDIDYQGSQTVRSVKEELDRLGVTLVLCDVEPRVRGELDAYGLTAAIGEDHVFDSLSEVLAAYRRLPPPTGTAQTAS